MGAVGMGLDALWRPFPALDVVCPHVMLPAGASDTAGFSCACHKCQGLWGALSLICGSWGSLVLENSDVTQLGPWLPLFLELS